MSDTVPSTQNIMGTHSPLYPIPITLLDRYLANQQRDEDLDTLRQWMADNPEHAKLVDAFQSLRVHETAPSDNANIERALQRVHREYGAGTEQSIPKSQPLSTVRYSLVASRWTRPMAYLVSVLTVVFALVTGWIGGVYRVNERMATSVSAYATGNGERATITLPDGSIVVLSVASRLYVPANYAAGNRTVHLSGEAFFTVTHQSGISFTVVAGHSTTRVLGTRFTVRHYATDTTAVVAVRDGKVAVGQVVLGANQKVIITPLTSPKITAALPGQFTFARGILTLDDMTFREAIVELNRWYNADIQLADPSLAMRGIGGSFAAGSLSDLITLLEMTYDVRVTRAGNVITLFPR